MAVLLGIGGQITLINYEEMKINVSVKRTGGSYMETAAIIFLAMLVFEWIKVLGGWY
jgi:hypothetical protein